MRTILVTGGIASGKSAVCAHLQERGFPVYDCDSRTKSLYASVPGLRERVEAAIGVPLQEAEIIFRDPVRREALEAVVYPEVLADILRWRQAQQADTVIIESAIALDKPVFDGLFDEVILVVAPLEVRLRRNPKAAQRIHAQPPIDPARADYLIINDGDLASLYRKTDDIL